MSETNPQRRRWPRRLAWALVGLVALAALMVVGLEVAVRQPAVRQAVVQRLADAVADRTGLSLAIDDLRASLFAGSVEIDGLTLSRPEAAPILTVEHIAATWRLSSLWDGPFTLKRLAISTPELDLRGPLPELPPASEQTGTGFALAIEHFELGEGRVDGPVVSSELRSWIDEWWLEDVTLAGWYGPPGLDLDLASQLFWRRSDGERVEISLDGKLAGPRDGPWDLTRMTLVVPDWKQR